MQKKCVIRDKCILLFTLLIFSIGTYSLFGNTRGINLFDLAAYQHRIKGVVTDTNGIPIQGVNVKLQDASQGTFTNEDGIFYLEASPSDVLVVSYIGFKTLVVKVGDTEELSLVLEEDVTDLGAVTVNAGYYTVSEKERTGSISKITAAAIEEQPVTNVLATMQGQMPGVNISQTTGMPGGGFSIQIRGQNSLRLDANAPLYVIDGVPYASEGIGSNSTSGVLAGSTSPLNSINPDNIASIEVLKDADATAIYGSRGANGVVLITTKKGKAGKTQIVANYSYGLGQVTRFIDLMDTTAYLQMRREAFANDGITNYPSNAYDVNGTWDQHRYTDWQEVLTGGSAAYTNAGISISGGGSQTNFFLSGNFLNQTTVFPGDFRYQKGNVHLGINHTSTDQKFSVSFSGTYTTQDNNLPYTDLTYISRTLPPNAPALYNSDESLNWENGTFNNPLSAFEGEFNAITYDLVANSLISYKPFRGLELSSSFGYTNLQHRENNSNPSTLYNPAFGIGPDNSAIFLTQTNRDSWIIEPRLRYQTKLGTLSMDFLTGATFQNRTNYNLGQLAIGFPSNSLIHNLEAASSIQVNGYDNAMYRYQALFGRVNLNFKGRYILNLTGRRDGSSRFGPGNQFANFGAIGAAWLFAEETWVKKGLPFISFGKLRGSYGITGSDQIGDYQYLDTYATSGGLYGGNVGLTPTRLFNSNFGWETNKKLELALETGFLKDRLFFTTAWYKNRSSNQLVGIPLPATTGFTSIQANLNATVENQGWEFTLRSVNLNHKDWNWTTNMNLTIPENKLLSFPDLEGSTYRNRLVIGKALNIDKVYHYTGLNSDTGVYEFEDYNNDGAIASPDDRQFIQDLNPKFFGGIQNQISYKQFKFDFLFQFVKKEAPNAFASFGMPGLMSNQPLEVSDRWQNPNTLGTYQRYSTGVDTEIRNGYLNYQQSNAAISDASFIRLKNLSISYTIPKKWFYDIECRIFMQGQNLLTFTPYKGGDPEFEFSGRLPPLKLFTTGIELRF
ncbi:MAG: SusC/RagA family TonB-linked outer membrane protein [Galbibacter orientalis]|uniref:SusC/RagA family TonB-linked outer membrane protein n=1 Tax=Galbibacter orientalis TaxID=453852 RepID=UPI003003646B